MEDTNPAQHCLKYGDNYNNYFLKNFLYLEQEQVETRKKTVESEVVKRYLPLDNSGD